jgi:arabinan endo-1,5-alpha-L-arabinosidase
MQTRPRRLARKTLISATIALAACTAPPQATPTLKALPATAPPLTPTDSAPLAVTALPSATLTAAPASTLTLVPTLAPAPVVKVLPVLDRDFPDPDVLRVGDLYYAYATNSGTSNIQVARSADLFTWEWLGDALPALPDWAVPEFGFAWAPDVSRSTDGATYTMYFTARYALGTSGGGAQCIGVATSPAPEGPFTPQGDRPLVCPIDQGGAIDASTFVDDDGAAYLLWKNDGNSGGGRSYLHLQPLAADGYSLAGEPVQLLGVDRRWEGLLVEAPTLWKQDGRYYLFYSANDFSSPRYAIGVAVADDIRGPYEKAADPLLTTQLKAGLVGPGGQDVVTGPDGQTWLLFHTWAPEAYRSLSILPLSWVDGWPVVELPTNP